MPELRLATARKRQEEGQGILEFILTLPVWLLLVWMIWSFALHWWMQVSAATAVHDGVAAAAQGGTLAEGRRRAEHLLEASLGAQGAGLRERLLLQRVPSHRSVYGSAAASWRSPLSYWGFPEMPVAASSFQRDERFYGGAPDGWE
jgi:hypothetical protein